MDTITRLNGKITKDKSQERYCSIYESFEQSL